MTLLALILTLELRDLETHGHSERVMSLATEFGRCLGLNAHELEALRQGAYLHDVGKLAIPAGVLLKAGVLSPEEQKQMQTHAAIGADMVGRIPTVPAAARQIIRHHHEWWDGTGYPDGLQGEAIPLLARMVSLVDVYDALTSTRPYKNAWTHKAAAIEIHQQAGVQFDPSLVNVFLPQVDRWVRPGRLPV